MGSIDICGHLAPHPASARSKRPRSGFSLAVLLAGLVRGGERVLDERIAKPTETPERPPALIPLGSLLIELSLASVWLLLLPTLLGCLLGRVELLPL
jgi:hypothetical protein